MSKLVGELFQRIRPVALKLTGSTGLKPHAPFYTPGARYFSDIPKKLPTQDVSTRVQNMRDAELAALTQKHGANRYEPVKDNGIRDTFTGTLTTFLTPEEITYSTAHNTAMYAEATAITLGSNLLTALELFKDPATQEYLCKLFISEFSALPQAGLSGVIKAAHIALTRTSGKDAPPFSVEYIKTTAHSFSSPEPLATLDLSKPNPFIKAGKDRELGDPMAVAQKIVDANVSISKYVKENCPYLTPEERQSFQEKLLPLCKKLFHATPEPKAPLPSSHAPDGKRNFSTQKPLPAPAPQKKELPTQAEEEADLTKEKFVELGLTELPTVEGKTDPMAAAQRSAAINPYLEPDYDEIPTVACSSKHPEGKKWTDQVNAGQNTPGYSGGRTT